MIFPSNNQYNQSIMYWISHSNFMEHKFTIIMPVKHESDQTVIDIAKCCVKSARFVMLNSEGPAGCAK